MDGGRLKGFEPVLIGRIKVGMRVEKGGPGFHHQRIERAPVRQADVGNESSVFVLLLVGRLVERDVLPAGKFIEQFARLAGIILRLFVAFAHFRGVDACQPDRAAAGELEGIPVQTDGNGGLRGGGKRRQGGALHCGRIDAVRCRPGRQLILRRKGRGVEQRDEQERQQGQETQQASGQERENGHGTASEG